MVVVSVVEAARALALRVAAFSIRALRSSSSFQGRYTNVNPWISVRISSRMRAMSRIPK